MAEVITKIRQLPQSFRARLVNVRTIPRVRVTTSNAMVVRSPAMWTRDQQERLSTAVMQAVELRLVAVVVAAAVARVSVAAARAGPILTATEAPATGQVAPAAMLSQLSVDGGSGR